MSECKSEFGTVPVKLTNAKAVLKLGKMCVGNEENTVGLRRLGTSC